MTTATAAVSARREPELLGQTVVVIGGSAGIGLETARRACAEGASVIPLRHRRRPAARCLMNPAKQEEALMDDTLVRSETADAAARRPTVDLKLEAVVIPVADVDRAKAFYGRLGWRLDADFPFPNGLRVVQFTPPGSGCSVQFGTKITTAAPGSAQGLYLIAADIAAAPPPPSPPRPPPG